MGSTSQPGRSYLQGDIQTLVLITLEREKRELGTTTLAIVLDLLIAHCAPPRRGVKKASTEGKEMFPDGKSIPKSLTIQPSAHSTLPPALPTHTANTSHHASPCVFCSSSLALPSSGIWDFLFFSEDKNFKKLQL